MWVPVCVVGLSRSVVGLSTSMWSGAASSGSHVQVPINWKTRGPGQVMCHWLATGGIYTLMGSHPDQPVPVTG